MNTETLARATFVLDKSTAQDLAYVSSRMGQSRSELVREILGPPVHDLAAILRSVPDNPTPEQVELFRSQALALVESQYDQGVTVLRGSGDV